MPGSHSSCRTPIVATLLLAVGLLFLPVTGVSDSPPSQTQQSKPTTQKATEASQPVSPTGGHSLWWLYISGLGLAVLIPVGVFFYRRYGREETYEFHEDDYRADTPPADQPAFVEGKTTDSGLSAPEKAFFSVEESSPSKSTTQLAISQSGGAQRMCPECGEQFPASVVLCPYDSTPLQTIESQRSIPSSDQTVLDRQRCPGCGRRYEPGPAYCYHDGMRLRQDTAEEAEDAPTYKACETCGWEGDIENRLCPQDGAELTTISPAEEDRVSPPVPVLICPKCESFAPPGHAHCPDDDAVLTPLHNAQLPQLPERGFGPRRKICQECGETFSQGAAYCSFDGSELVPMN